MTKPAPVTPKKIETVAITHYQWRSAIMETGLPSSSKLVAATLFSYLNSGQNRAWPSIDTLKRQTSLSRRSVVTHLQNLSANGWLKQVRQGGRANGTNTTSIYEICAPSAGLQPIKKGVQPLNPTTDSGVQPFPVGVQPFPYRGATIAHELPKELTKEYIKDSCMQSVQSSSKPKTNKTPIPITQANYAMAGMHERARDAGVNASGFIARHTDRTWREGL